MTKPLVIYHANCADGFGAAFAAWLRLGDEAEYVAASYGEEWLIDPRQRDVYILDFSFKRDTMDFIFEFAKRVVWLDHHKTAFEMWCGGIPEKGWLSELRNCTPDNPHGTVEIHLHNEESGAYLAWKYFHPGTEVPMLIKHIDDYDRWQFKIEGTKAFNKALWSYAPWNFEQWGEWLESLTWNPDAYRQFIAEGSAILRAHDRNVQSVVKGAARPCTIVNPDMARSMHASVPPWVRGIGGRNHMGIYEHETVTGLAANCPPHLTSDVGHELATKSKMFGLCWTLSQTGLTAKCSLRSNGDYDVSAIAKAFGGGGHRNAAGFEVPMGTLLGWLK